MLSPFLIVKPPAAENSGKRPYSDVEYSRIVRSLMEISRVPMAINYTPGQSILPDGFERSILKAGIEIRSIRTKAIDVLDRGLLVVPTRETLRLRGVRIPSQFIGTESSRAAGRESIRILREMVRSGDLEVLPGVPIRDPSGSILVEIHLEGGDTLNALLIRQGLAMTEPSDYDTVGTPMAANLQGLQTEARRSKLGLWARR
jgi:endonuclease YncB( thermonuclease family)